MNVDISFLTGGGSFFSYRLPGAPKPVYGMARRPLEGIHSGGFVMAPFSGFPSRTYTIVPELCPTSFPDFLPIDSERQPHSTPRAVHRREVEEIVHELGGHGKTVAARRLVVCGELDMAETFRSLCESYPDAFVFCFSSPVTGTWIGASPELLLKTSGGRLESMSLAGTRPSGSEGEWDVKNIEEQRLVTEFITETLTRHLPDVSASEPRTHVAGPVEHICTRISARVPGNLDTATLGEILGAMSPTPALCGNDRTASLSRISRLEDFDREYYGGFCGPIENPAACSLYVNLRSARIYPECVALVVGGGITPLSKPDSEWEETEKKASTLIKHLKFIVKQ